MFVQVKNNEEKDSSKSTTSYYDEAEVDAILNKIYEIERDVGAQESHPAGASGETVSSEYN